MKRLALIAALSLLCGIAHAQSTPTPNGVNGAVRQFGTITPNNCVKWKGNSYIQDSGGTCSGGSSITLTTTGSSGPAALVGGNLNVPVYGGLPSTTTAGQALISTSTSGVAAWQVPVTITGDLSVTATGGATVTGIQGNAVTAVTGSGGIVMENVSPVVATGISIGNALTFSAAVPTIASGFGSGASITTGTDTSFVINVGTGGSATSGVVAMNATAANGWNCSATDQSTPATMTTKAISSTTTAVTFNNYLVLTATAGAWTASDLVAAQCSAR